ncbi:MAG: hypothetical protein ACE5Q6_21475 [Dehalococcoidia bacterium]
MNYLENATLRQFLYLAFSLAGDRMLDHGNRMVGHPQSLGPHLGGASEGMGNYRDRGPAPFL